MKVIDRFHWRNWLGNQQCTATLCEPRAHLELDGDVARAAQASSEPSTALRPVGASYAWSGLVPTSGALLRLPKEAFSRVLEVDREKLTLEVEAGMTLRQLVEAATANGMVVPSVPIFLDLSVGGALAVGAHGTGQRWGTLSDALLSLTLITVDGVRRTIHRGEPDFPAAQVSLGAMGVIYAARFQCMATFNVRVDQGFAPTSAIEEIADVLASYEFVEIFWFLTEDVVWVELMNRTDAPVEKVKPWSRLWAGVKNLGVRLAGSTLFPFMARRAPGLLVQLLQVAYTFINPVRRLPSPKKKGFRAWLARVEAFLRPHFNPFDSRVLTPDDAFHYIRRYPKVWNSEACIECTPEAVTRIWDAIEATIGREGDRGRFPVNFGLHVRFIGPSMAWMAPAHGRASCYLDVVTLRGTPGAQQFLDDVEELVLKDPAGRPHWGKYFNPENAAAIAAHYPRLADFVRARDAIDPERKLVNELLESLLR